jgi:hypothetical protein
MHMLCSKCSAASCKLQHAMQTYSDEVFHMRYSEETYSKQMRWQKAARQLYAILAKVLQNLGVTAFKSCRCHTCHTHKQQPVLQLFNRSQIPLYPKLPVQNSRAAC